MPSQVHTEPGFQPLPGALPRPGPCQVARCLHLQSMKQWPRAEGPWLPYLPASVLEFSLTQPLLCAASTGLHLEGLASKCFMFLTPISSCSLLPCFSANHPSPKVCSFRSLRFAPLLAGAPPPCSNIPAVLTSLACQLSGALRFPTQQLASSALLPQATISTDNLLSPHSTLGTAWSQPSTPFFPCRYRPQGCFLCPTRTFQHIRSLMSASSALFWA